MTGKNPIAIDYMNGATSAEIIYACPECWQDFRTHAWHEKFCHNCGCKIDWEKMPTHLNNLVEIDSLDFQARAEFIKQLNEDIKNYIKVCDEED